MTNKQASKSKKGLYEHPYTGKPEPRLTMKEYNEIPDWQKKYIHAGAKPPGVLAQAVEHLKKQHKE